MEEDGEEMGIDGGVEGLVEVQNSVLARARQWGRGKRGCSARGRRVKAVMKGRGGDQGCKGWEEKR